MTKTDAYTAILESKKVKSIESGFHIELSDLNPKLKGFQKYSVQKALKFGRFGLFQPPGAGKTIQQLEWGTQIFKYTGMPVILLAPLAVIGQTIDEEAPKFGYEVRELVADISIDKLKECAIWAPSPKPDKTTIGTNSGKPTNRGQCRDAPITPFHPTFSLNSTILPTINAN